MKRRTLVLGLCAALACFGAGVVAGQRSLAAPPPPAPASAGQPLPDAGGKAPKIIFEPGSLSLLPDASLRLDFPLPLPADAGTP